MSAPAIVTSIGLALLAVALAAYLAYIAWILSRVSSGLGKLFDAIQTVAKQVEPIDPVTGAIGEDVRAIAVRLHEAERAAGR